MHALSYALVLPSKRTLCHCHHCRICLCGTDVCCICSSSLLPYLWPCHHPNPNLPRFLQLQLAKHLHPPDGALMSTVHVSLTVVPPPFPSRRKPIHAVLHMPLLLTPSFPAHALAEPFPSIRLLPSRHAHRVPPNMAYQLTIKSSPAARQLAASKGYSFVFAKGVAVGADTDYNTAWFVVKPSEVSELFTVSWDTSYYAAYTKTMTRDAAKIDVTGSIIPLQPGGYYQVGAVGTIGSDLNKITNPSKPAFHFLNSSGYGTEYIPVLLAKDKDGNIAPFWAADTGTVKRGRSDALGHGLRSTTMQKPSASARSKPLNLTNCECVLDATPNNHVVTTMKFICPIAATHIVASPRQDSWR
jgi:hypothetical protein